MSTAVPQQSQQSLVNSELPEIQNLIKTLQQSKIPEELKDRVMHMTGRLMLAARVGGYTSEFESIKKYIDWITAIPWGTYTQDNLDLKSVESILSSNHYGLQEVKNTILEYMAVMKLKTGNTPIANPAQDKPQQQAKGSVEADMKKLKGSSANAPILCFVGIQGVGKTSMAKSIANALGRKFVRISLGAMGSATELRGRNKGEQDAEPGQIIKALSNTGVMNPLILLDEIDKVSSQSGLRADIMAVLLEILDPEQNATFVDHFIDYPVNLSNAMFITTANNLGGISTALLDRLEVVRFTSYSPEDKKIIAKNYLLPKIREAVGLSEQQLQFSDDVWDLVINPLGFDAGIRQLERNLTKLARKVAKRIVDGITTSVTITPQNFREFIPQDIEIYS